MRSLYKNENSLFRGFQEFLARKQHVPEKRLPYYLRWVSRFHEFCSRRNIDGNGKDSILTYLQDLAKDHGGWQVHQAKEAIRCNGTSKIFSGPQYPIETFKVSNMTSAADYRTRFNEVGSVTIDFFENPQSGQGDWGEGLQVLAANDPATLQPEIVSPILHG